MRCVHPWPGDTDQVGRLAGAPPRAPGRRVRAGRRRSGARASGCSAATRPGVGGPTAPPTPQAARLAPCLWVVRPAVSPVAARSI